MDDRIFCTDHLMVLTYLTALNVRVYVVPDISSESCSLPPLLDTKGDNKISTAIGVISVGKTKDEGYCKWSCQLQKWASVLRMKTLYLCFCESHPGRNRKSLEKQGARQYQYLVLTDSL